MLKGLFILDSANLDKIYGPAEMADISARVELVAPPQSATSIRADLNLLREVEVIFSGWGGPQMDTAFLDAAPALKAVFYGAGTVRHLVTDAFWARDIQITTAAAANAVPVAEYTLAQILLSLKQMWYYADAYKGTQLRARDVPVAGVYGSTVGLISLGLIGARVAELLRPFDLHIVAYDPFVGAEAAAALGVELMGLDEVFAVADVVSLHTPWLKATEGLITGAHFARMKPHATFINTARGAVVREADMIAVLQERPDLYALLDVTYPEPPAPDSPLFTLPNVIITPHIAGAMDHECRRMGRYMVEELERYLAGEPLRYALTAETFAITA